MLPPLNNCVSSSFRQISSSLHALIAVFLRASVSVLALAFFPIDTSKARVFIPWLRFLCKKTSISIYFLKLLPVGNFAPCLLKVPADLERVRAKIHLDRGSSIQFMTAPCKKIRIGNVMSCALIERDVRRTISILLGDRHYWLNVQISLTIMLTLLLLISYNYIIT